MGLLDYSRANPWVSDALATLSQGLLTYGSGNQNAMAQLPQFLAERQRYRKDDARQAKMDQRQEQIWQLQQEEAERVKNKDAAQKRAAMGLLGGPAAPNGMSQAQFGGAPTQPGLLGNFDQPTQNYIKTLVDSGDYGSAIDTYGKLVTSKPEGPNSSLAKAKADLDRGYITPEEYQAFVNKETYIAPQQPREEQLLQVWDGKKLVYLPKSQAAGMPAAAPEQPENPLGNSFDANAINFLTNGNPSDPMYVAVYNQMAQPKLTFDQATGRMVTISPDMSAYRQPATAQSPGAQQPSPAVPGQLPPPNMRGTPTMPAPTQAPQAGSAGGVKVSQIEAPTKVKEARAEAATLIKSLTTYKDSYSKATKWERGKSIAGAGTALNTAYNGAALLAKGEALFNLGVLNGPDLDIIRRTIVDPSTVTSVFVSPDEAEAQTDAVIELIQTRINEYEKQNDLPPTDFGGSADNDPLGIR